MSDQGDRVGRLIEALRAIVEDPLTPGVIEALWDVDFQNQLRAVDEDASDIEQSLDEISNQTGTGVLGLEIRQVLERFRHAAFIVRADGRIEAMNLLARRTIDVDPGQFVDDIGYDLMPAERLSKTVIRFLDPNRNAGDKITLLRAFARDTERSATLALVTQSREQRTALLFVIDASWQAEAGSIARRAFGLTTAESEILAEFLDGKSLRKIAAKRSSTYATVRTQFQSVMAKFGCSTQAGLVRTALGLSQFVEDLKPVSKISRHPYRRTFNVLARGGRKIEVVLSGDFTGVPVVFLPDCTLYTFAERIERQFRNAGVCVASIGRPGYGGTDKAPDGADDLDCMAGDVRAVLNQLDAGSAVVAAHGVSSVFAYAIAAALPGRIGQVVIFSGTLPRPYINAGLSNAPFAAALLRAGQAAPRVFRLLVRASVGAWRQIGVRRFNAMNLAKSPSDSQIARDDACVEEFEDALEGSLAQGFHRIESDLRLGTGDWSDRVTACPVKILLLHGVEDPVTGIADVRQFATRNKNTRLVEFEDTGYLLHHTRPEELARALADAG